MPETQEFVATGRRKTSVARIHMTPGNGKIDINGRSFEDYFPTAPLQNVVLQPLQTAKAVNAMLRRDPRMKERKKSGQPGARKRFQFSKR